MLSHPNPPLVISTSYGDDEQTVPESFAKRACAGFAQLGEYEAVDQTSFCTKVTQYDAGARGVSLVFSSGGEVSF
jgi:hypothetical protein